jgi:hypothetical protein
MIRIEMSLKPDDSSESGVARGEYIWMIGQPWPVPEGHDVEVQRIEAFGPEMDFVNHFPGGRRQEVGVSEVHVWHLKEAKYVSTEMRKLAV